MILYKELKDDFSMSEYVRIFHNKKLRNVVSKLRLSSNRLAIESGRHIGTERQNRKCIFCTTNDTEDEYHFVLICRRYSNLRMHHTLLKKPKYDEIHSALKCCWKDT